MADEFINQGVVCSANWWNPSRSALFAGGMSHCSGAGAYLGSFGLPVEVNDFTGLASSTNSDWNQALLFGGEGSCNGIRTPTESNFSSNNFMHESGSSDNSSQVHNDWSPGMVGNFAGKPVDDHEDASPMSSFKNHMGFPTQPPDNYGSNHIISSSSSSCGYTSDMIKSFLLDQPELSSVDYSSAQFMAGYGSSCSDESSPASFGKLPSLLKPINSSLPNPPQPNKLHLSNNMPYWHASSSALDDIHTGLFGPSQSSTLVGSSPEEKPNHSISKANSQYSRASGPVAEKKANPEPAFKRARIETPSPLPTFKVRKEKLGDRITALQQLVSPFGKTDTASVLHEAIEYIKFLHDQVHVLSSPYMKNGVQVQHQQACTDRKAMKDLDVPKTDLRSRGLCLVSISSTFPVASETPADFWTPTFGRSFR